MSKNTKTIISYTCDLCDAEILSPEKEHTFAVAMDIWAKVALSISAPCLMNDGDICDACQLKVAEWLVRDLKEKVK